MKKWITKKTVAGVTVAAVGMATIANASGLDTVFDPGNYKWFEDLGKQKDNYDYIAGNGEEADLADQNKNSDQNTGKDAGEQSVRLADQQDLLNQDQGLLDTSNPLGLADGSDDATDESGKGVEFVNNGDNNGSGNGQGNDNPGNGNGSGNSNNGSGTGGNGNGDENGGNGSNTGKDDQDESQKQWINDQLKPNDPIMTEYGELTGLSASFKEGKGTYCRGDKFQAADVEVTARYRKDGQTVTRTLPYGGKDGYSVSFSTYSGYGDLTAVFSYKGITARAAYRVMISGVQVKFHASSSLNDLYYGNTFPGKSLLTLAGGDQNSIDIWNAINLSPNNRPTSGGTVNLENAHVRMIALLGDERVKSQFAEDGETAVTLEEGADGYLTNMLQGFTILDKNQIQDSRYMYYPVEEWGNVSMTVIDVVAKVPEDYKIRRVIKDQDNWGMYRGAQVLEKYTGSDKVLKVPQGVTAIDLKETAESVESIELPDSVIVVNAASLAKYLPNLKNINYEIDNKEEYGEYQTVNGMLLSKDGSKLIAVPAGISDVVIPDTVTTLGKNCLKGIEAKTISFAGKDVPKLEGTTGYKGTIIVPDSTYDQVRRQYMFAFGEECANIKFVTESDPNEKYVYDKDEKVLLYKNSATDNSRILAGIPTTAKGRYTVGADIDKIGNAAFAGCTKLTDLVVDTNVKELEAGSLILPDSVSTVELCGKDIDISPYVFGNPEDGAKVPDIHIIVDEDAYEQYLEELTDILDPVYGNGTAKSLLAVDKDTIIYENGAKYRKIVRDGKEVYRLEHVYDDTMTSMAVKDNTVEIASNAFTDCDRLEILYLPASVESVGENVFTPCKSLETVAINNNSDILKNAGADQAEVLSTGNDYKGFEWETDGVLYATRANGSNELINVPTNYSNTLSVKENTTVLHQAAIKNCTQITKVDLKEEKALEEIGSNCFEGCTGLGTVDFNGFEQLKSIGAYAFKECTGLQSVVWPENVSELKEGTFQGCSRLAKTDLKNVKSIGTQAFEDCITLYELKGGDILESIGAKGFYNCRALHSVTLPETVKFIGESCFENCADITSVELNGSLSGISRYCFYGCKNLQNIKIGDSQKKTLQFIGVEAFGQCSSLTAVDWSNLTALTQMGANALEGCSDLLTVKLPQTLKQIPDNCFEGCESLSLLQVNAVSVPALGSTVFGENVPEYLHIRVPEESLEEYRTQYRQVLDPEYGEGTADRLLEVIDEETEVIRGLTYKVTPEGRILQKADKNYTGVYTVESDVIAIADDAFNGCDGVTGFVVPKEVTVELGNRCFKGCKGLKSVNIQGNVPAWGDETFMQCETLETLAFSNASAMIERIGTRAFKDCVNLGKSSNISFATKIKVIGKESFSGCSSITGVSMSTGDNGFQGNLTSIEDYAFYGCKKMSAFLVTKLSALTSIGNYAFSECDAMKQPSVSASVRSLGEGCFMGCDNLMYVSFYGAIEEYPKYCFKDCPKLVRTGGKAEAFAGLKRIGEGAYENCVALNNSTTSWNISKYTNLESIGDNAFRGCVSLGADTISASVASVGAGAFDDCRRMTALTFKNATPPTIGAFSMENRPSAFMIYVPDSKADGDSVYQAYYEVLKGLVGEDVANQILDSVSDGAKARHDAALAEPEETSGTEEETKNPEQGAVAGAGDPPEETNPGLAADQNNAGDENSQMNGQTGGQTDAQAEAQTQSNVGNEKEIEQ